MATRRMVYNEAIEKERDRDFRKKERELEERVKRRQIKKKRMVSTDAAKAKRLAARARRMEALADWIEDDDAYVRKVQRAEKVYAASDRLNAKVKGKEAGVLIAKARKAKVKKAELTRIATQKNAESRAQGERARGLEKYLAYDEGMYTTDKSGKKRFLKKKALQKQIALDVSGKPTNPIFGSIKGARFYEKYEAKQSKAAARKSGGTATGIKRTAEAAIGRIAQGKALKGAARAGGVLGMISVFNAALNGSTKKNKRG